MPSAGARCLSSGRHLRGDETGSARPLAAGARDILDELTRRNVKLSLGGSIHDPTDPVGRLLFNVLAMVAEFEADLIRLRTREGMQVAKAKGRLRGKQPKLKPNQAKHLLELHELGTYTQAEFAELFGVGRSTIYRTLDRVRPAPPEPERPFAHADGS
jgi:DNA invertase Pin-like site-specific DNA recombinase